MSYHTSAVKTLLERLHIHHLCRSYRVCEPNQLGLTYPELQPDLTGRERNGSPPKVLFELKSRNFPRKPPRGDRKRTAPSYGWWSLDEEQITGYEQIRAREGIELFWILLRSHTLHPPTEITNLNFRHIRGREIFVVPWDAYQLVQPSLGLRHLGLARIKEKYTFTSRPDGLHLEQGIEDKVKAYFP